MVGKGSITTVYNMKNKKGSVHRNTRIYRALLRFNLGGEKQHLAFKTGARVRVDMGYGVRDAGGTCVSV